MIMFGGGNLAHALGRPAPPPPGGRGGFTLPAAAARKRCAGNVQLDHRWLGFRILESREHSGRQRRRAHQRHHRPREQGPAAQAGRLGRAPRLGVGRVTRAGLSREDPAVDAKRVGIEGVSRYGKAALVTMAFDQRFALVLIGSSGEGGAKLHRRNWGEAVESLTGSGEYHWMAGNFLKYGARKRSSAARTPATFRSMRMN